MLFIATFFFCIWKSLPKKYQHCPWSPELIKFLFLLNQPALFGLFTLMIIYVKRQHERPDYDFDGTIEGLIAPKSVAHMAASLFEARIFSKSWSLTLGWCGVLLCSITSGMWIMLSKIMRYNSYSST